jgi:hypothetical protein
MNSGSRLLKLNENSIILNDQINDVMEKRGPKHYGDTG